MTTVIVVTCSLFTLTRWRNRRFLTINYLSTADVGSYKMQKMTMRNTQNTSVNRLRVMARFWIRSKVNVAEIT